jgi:DnaJ-like protein
MTAEPPGRHPRGVRQPEAKPPDPSPGPHPRTARRRARAGPPDPFDVLGLEHRADLADTEVHAAWRRIASATHPDREDGGDPARFAEAAAAYTTLRTRFGRGEALADLAAPSRGQVGGRPGVMTRWGGRPLAAAARLPSRVRRGRPARLALRVLAALAVGAAAVLAAGPHPAAPALGAGVATWLVLTARRDLAPPQTRRPADPP